MSSSIPLVALAFACCAFAGLAGAQELLPNADLAEWMTGRPAGWRVEIGATTRAEGSESELSAIERGLALAGDAGTARWRYLSCPFDAQPGMAYRLTPELRLLGGAVEPGQFENHWAALEFVDAAGNRLARNFASAQGDGWFAPSLVSIPPEGAAEGRVAVFLSHTGRLEVRNLSLRAYGVGDGAELLVEELDRHYSYFFLKDELDWRTHAAPFVERLRGEQDTGVFVEGVVELLGALRDNHVWVDPPRGRRVPTFHLEGTPNFALPAVMSRIRGVRQIGKLGLVGHTPEGYGYVLLDTFQASAEEFSAMEQAVRALLEAPALVIDARTCSGGDETLGWRIAGLFTDAPVAYARTAYRAGPAHDAFGPEFESVLPPAGDVHYAGPVACLVGPSCVSSGERFAQALRALPDAVLVGAPTAGSSGNPAPLVLPNGVTVWYSRWVNRNPDGSLVEGRGVPPDVPVAWTGAGDPVLDAAIAELGRRLRERED